MGQIPPQNFFLNHPPPLKKRSKTFLRKPICQAEVPTEPRWRSLPLMILGIRIHKVTGWRESFHRGRIPWSWCHKFKQNVENQPETGLQIRLHCPFWAIKSNVLRAKRPPDAVSAYLRLYSLWWNKAAGCV